MSSSDDGEVVKKLKGLQEFAQTFADGLGLPLVNDHGIITTKNDDNNTEYIIYLTRTNGIRALSLKFSTRRPSVWAGKYLYDHKLSIGFVDSYDYKYITLDDLVPGYYTDQQLTAFNLWIAPGMIKMAALKAYKLH
jgi:hypothetical protein